MAYLIMTVTALYPHPVPEDLIPAVEASMHQHLKAYGLKDVVVSWLTAGEAKSVPDGHKG